MSGTFFLLFVISFVAASFMTCMEWRDHKYQGFSTEVPFMWALAAVSAFCTIAASVA